MNENKILSNVEYGIHNRSNYDITLTETQGIIDVPHFPAQNLVDVSGDISLYRVMKHSILAAVPFFDDNIHKERLFFLHNRLDARMNFIEIAEDARYYHYSFSGLSYPQGREQGAAITYDGTCLYLFGGICNNRCTQDLWQFSFKDNRWTNLNFSVEEKGANEAPTKRAESSIIAVGNKIWLFGGYTDVLAAHMEGVHILDLNDLWSFDVTTQMWTNYDKNRVLPHRRGHIVYVDDTKVHIAIKGGVAATGEPEPDGIWTVDLTNDSVSFMQLDLPFTFSPRNMTIWVDGVVYIFEFISYGSYNVYSWSESAKDFVQVFRHTDGIVAINPRTKAYWAYVPTEKYFGDNPSMGKITVDNFACYDNEHNLVFETDITLPPIGVELTRVNIDNHAIFWYAGTADGHTFNESTYIMDNTTRQVEKLDFPPDQRPTERIFPAMAYDRYRGRVWLFGGFDGSKFYNDLWYFDLSEKKWHKVHDHLENTDEERPDYPQPRQKAAVAVVVNGKYLYLMGGYSDEHSFNDLWQYDISNDQWKRIQTVDNIPWGSVYYLFEWRDRLWLFNGQKLYRFIYSTKRFVEQELVFRNADNFLKKIVDSQAFMQLPVDLQLIRDMLFIRCPETTLSVDMETRVVTDYKVVYNTDTTPDLWIDVYRGVKLTDSDIVDFFFNTSPLQVLTVNQLPHSFDFGTYAAPNPATAVVFDPFAPSGEPRTSYIDARGVYKIQDNVEHFDGEKVAKLIENSEASSVAFPSDGDTHTGTGTPVEEKLKENWVSLYRPIFMYKHTKSPSDKIKYTATVVYDYADRKAYIAYKSGHIIRYNLNDGTTFVYNSRIPYQSAVGYYPTRKRFYAFGGAATSTTDYPILTQHGYRYVPFVHTVSVKVDDTPEVLAEVWQLDTPVLRAYDLGLVTLQQNAIENYLNENNIEFVDYQIVKNYLLDMLKHYTSSTAYQASESPLTPQALAQLEERVKDAIYKDTQELLDDLSTVDVTFESGARPLGRMYAVSATVGNKLLVAGGAQVFCFRRMDKVQLTQLPTPAPDAGMITNEPYCPTYVGHLTACQLATEPVSSAEVYDYLGITAQEESKKAFLFDMEKKEWREAAPMPEWRYLASAITSPDGKYVYVVGGYTQPLCQGLTNKILRYDVNNDRWDYMTGIPHTFLPRAQPVLFWLDDYHLVIAFGYEAVLQRGSKFYMHTNQKDTDVFEYSWIHMPVRDAWIYDTRAGLFYKAWEDLYTPPVTTITTKYTDDKQVHRKIYCVSNSAIYKTKTEYAKSAITVFNTEDGTSEKIPVNINSSILKYAVTREQLLEALQASALQSSVYSYTQANNTSYTETYLEPMLRSEFITASKLSGLYYGSAYIRCGWIEQDKQTKHNILYMLAEVPAQDTEELPDWLKELVGEHNVPINMVVWYIDLDAEDKHVYEVKVSAPIAGRPTIVGYDGKGNLYFIYNKYTMWKLNFHKFIKDPSNVEWTMLPPCVNCNFLDIDYPDYWIPFFVPEDDPKYMVLFSIDGRMARMDIHTYTWYLDRSTPPHEFANTVLVTGIGIDNLELYMIPLIPTVHGGKVIHVFEKQWDNFYFDLTMFALNDKQAVYLNPRLYPVTVLRRRLYLINEQGHVYYSWLRLDGQFDVEYHLNSFYRAGEVRVYGDYKMLDQWENLEVSVFHIQYGWVDIPFDYFERVINETGWYWDAVFSRRYVRELMSASGEVLVQYSLCPPNYIKVKIDEKFGEEVPISKVRVKFRNRSVPYNMISKINAVELITRQHDINMYSSPSDPNPAEFFHIEALTPDEHHSNTIGITVKNISGAEAVNVVAYMKGNYWLEFSLNPSDDESWVIADVKNPMLLAEHLPPGGIVTFYVRAVNVDMRPHKDDIVVCAVIPYGT